jgi:hypothetical protein
MDQPGIRDCRLGGGNVNHVIFPGRSQQIPQRVTRKYETLRLRRIDAAACAFKARIDKFQIEDSDAGRRTRCRSALSCRRWLYSKNEKKDGP